MTIPDDDLKYVSVVCSTCRTRVSPPLRDEAYEVTCPDCLLKIAVPSRDTVRLRLEEKQRLQEKMRNDPAPYRLAQPSSDDGEPAILPELDSPFIDEPPSAALQDGGYERIVCLKCRRVIRVKARRQGRRVRCRGCGNQNYVPANLTAVESLSGSEMTADENADRKSVRSKSDGKRRRGSTPDLVGQADSERPGYSSGYLERMAEIREQEVDPPPARPFVSDVFTIAWAREVRVRTGFLAVGFSAVGILSAIILSLVAGASGYMGVVVAFFAMPLVWIGTWTFSYAAAVGLVVLEDTANGIRWPVHWLEPDWREWATKLMFLVFETALAATMSAGIAAVVAWISTSLAWTLFGASLLILTPILLLSALEADSVLLPFSPVILKSLIQRPLAWGKYFALTWAVCGGWLGLGWIGLHTFPTLTLILNGPLSAICWLIWMRLTGRIAWVILKSASGKKPSRRRSMKAVLLMLGGAAIGMDPAGSLDAQTVNSSIIVTPAGVDPTLATRFELVNDYLESQQWDAALDLIETLQAEHGDRLTEMDPGLFWSVTRRTQQVLCRLPTEALERYRTRVDARSRRLLEAGSPADLQPWLRLIDQYFPSRAAAEALEQLGELAWLNGNPDTARRYWQQLLPLTPDGGLEWRHPDALIPAAEIEARLILCSLAAGHHERAVRELVAFSAMYPDEQGMVAGQQGRYVELLKRQLESEQEWSTGSESEDYWTFQGNAARNGVLSEIDRPGPVLWSIELPQPREWTERTGPAGSVQRPPIPWTFPLVHAGRVFVATPDRVLGFELADGQAAWWGRIESDQLSSRQRLADATLFPGAVDESSTVAPRRPVLGQPFCSLTRSGHLLLARIGEPVTAMAEREMARWNSRIVCLDLDHAEGQLVWELNSSELGSGWFFDGTPVCLGKRGLSVVRRAAPETQLALVAFSLSDGRVDWLRPLCSVVTPWDGTHNQVTHTLLTATESLVYLATDQGDVLAIEPQQGRLEWFRSAVDGGGQFKRHGAGSAGPAPCLLDSGRVYLAAGGGGPMTCLDAATGAVIWHHQLEHRPMQILGVREGRLIVSGRGLWALDPETGSVQWTQLSSEPENSTWGRGVIAGSTVWWPRHDRIEFRNLRDGRPEAGPLPLEHRGGQGGNLLLADPYLIISESGRLVVYSPFAGIVPESRDPQRHVR